MKKQYYENVKQTFHTPTNTGIDVPKKISLEKKNFSFLLSLSFFFVIQQIFYFIFNYLQFIRIPRYFIQFFYFNFAAVFLNGSNFVCVLLKETLLIYVAFKFFFYQNWTFLYSFDIHIHFYSGFILKSYFFDIKKEQMYFFLYFSILFYLNSEYKKMFIRFYF